MNDHYPTGPPQWNPSLEAWPEGWELATDIFSNTTVISASRGWGEVGTPIARQCFFKRRL